MSLNTSKIIDDTTAFDGVCDVQNSSPVTTKDVEIIDSSIKNSATDTDSLTVENTHTQLVHQLPSDSSKNSRYYSYTTTRMYSCDKVECIESNFLYNQPTSMPTCGYLKKVKSDYYKFNSHDNYPTMSSLIPDPYSTTVYLNLSNITYRKA